MAATHTIAPNGGNYRLVDGAVLGVAAGDTIIVNAGNHGQLEFKNITGTRDLPVIIRNSGGQVICDSPGGAALTLWNCQFVQLTGTGSAGVDYGFKVGTSYTRGGAHAVQVIRGSSDIEIDHVEVFSAGFAGFNVKDEPRVDGLYNRGNFVMENISLHHNYVHDTKGEGFYIGHTFYNGYDISGSLYYPHFIKRLKVYENHTLNTGAEGIQVGSTRVGMEVFNNSVESPGQDPFANFQNNGIQIGMSSGTLTGNTVRDAPGNGIIALTPGELVIACNVIERSGANGMFIDDRLSTPESITLGGEGAGSGFRVLNNTIVDCGQDASQETSNKSGIRLYANEITDTNYVFNNLVIGGPGPTYAFTKLNTSVQAVESGTRWSADGVGLGLTDAANGNYRLNAGFALINAGVGVQRFGIHHDRVGAGRTAGTAVDIGAYEFPQTASSNALNDSITGNVSFPYRLFVPVSAAPSNPLPLIVFLHGYGERGAANGFDNKAQVVSHIQPLINTARGSKYAAFLVAPQSPYGWSGKGAAVVTLVDYLVSTYAIDASRIYVTGLSDGGKGTWQTLAAGGTRFAAGVPLSAVSSTETVPAILQGQTPIWAFHGDADGTVGVGSTRTMISQLRQGGGLPRYSERAGWGHSDWKRVYGEEPGWTDKYAYGDPTDRSLQLYGWMFHQRRNPDAAAPMNGPVAGGDTLLFDFGDDAATPSPDATGRHWNIVPSVYQATGSLMTGVQTGTGRNTAAQLRVVDGFVGANSLGLLVDNLYPSTAQRDNLFAGSFSDRADGLLNPAVIRVENLPANTDCRVTLFCSRNGTDGGKDRLTRYTIGSEWRDLDAVDNSGNAAVFESVRTSAAGALDLTVALSPAGNGKFCYLSVMEVEVAPKLEVMNFALTGGTLGMGFRTKKGWRYQPRWSDELNVWQDMPGKSMVGTGLSATFEWELPSAKRRFYRVEDAPPQ